MDLDELAIALDTDFSELRQYLELETGRVAPIVQDIGQRQTSAGCLIKLGQVCTDLGEYTEASRHLKRALTITTELQDQTQMVGAAAALAALLAAEGSREREVFIEPSPS